MGAIPNFFIVGPPKAGTTSLYRYLGQHPAIYMSPIKEPCYFAPEVTEVDSAAREKFRADAGPLQAYLDGPMTESRPNGLTLEWNQYLKLFRRAEAETVIGEASVSYLSSTTAPGLIRQKIPHARIVAMLRDPAGRLFSHYAAARAAGATSSAFTVWVDEQLTSEAHRTPVIGPVWAGRYGTHIERYRSLFSDEQLRWCVYDDYVQDPRRVLRDLLSFLDVDPAYPIDVGERHNVTRMPRWPSVHAAARPVASVARAMAPAPVVDRIRRWWRVPVRLAPARAERARVIDIYREDIIQLEDLLHRRLAAWLDPEPPRERIRRA